MELKQLEEQIKNHKYLYIYGAGVVAGGAADAIYYLYNAMPCGYLVSETLDRCSIPNKEESFILIATPEQYHQDIINTLEECGYSSVDRICLTSHLEYLLMGMFLKQKSGYRLVDDCAKSILDKNPDIYIAEASSSKDVVLYGRYDKKDYINTVVCDKVDCPLDNSIYGELSATWWMTKNEIHDIMGLYHYRRDLILDDSDFSILMNGEADVILPLPFVCEPNTSGQYERYLQEKDQRVMWKVLEKKYPDFYMKAKVVLEGKYLYNYNILVARKDVFVAYSDWLFELLEEIAYECEMEERPGRLARYIGRIGEVLTSLYFMVNEQGLKVVHGEKRWKI